jgi:hypothetical protein
MLTRQELGLRELIALTGGANVRILDELAGDFRADALLCLFGGTADVRRQNDVVETCNGEANMSALDLGSTGKTSIAAPARCWSLRGAARASMWTTLPRALLTK